MGLRRFWRVPWQGAESAMEAAQSHCDQCDYLVVHHKSRQRCIVTAISAADSHSQRVSLAFATGLQHCWHRTLHQVHYLVMLTGCCLREISRAKCLRDRLGSWKYLLFELGEYFTYEKCVVSAYMFTYTYMCVCVCICIHIQTCTRTQWKYIVLGHMYLYIGQGDQVNHQVSISSLRFSDKKRLTACKRWRSHCCGWSFESESVEAFLFSFARTKFDPSMSFVI